ncbi:MAG: helix-turn-helix domain-containing protein [Flavobacteriaceae bacterium]|nr:helix-turn-helix domain-containing protein [Candidatus Onthonaster equi]
MNNLDFTTITIIVIALVCILIISLYFLMKKSSQTEQNNTIQNTTPEASLEVENDIHPIEETEKPSLEIIIDKKIEKPKNNIQLDEKQDDITNEERSQSKLGINISSKTEKVLLKKLENFEKNKGFLKKDVNLNNLAKQFDTNTKYLSEIIKSYKNKNFNQYLNELRINHLLYELENNEKVLNTKVSYLASDMGFSSHSSFSTLFTQYVGKSPSEYIKKLKEAKNTAELMK